MHSTSESRQLWKKIFALLPQRQKLGFFVVLLILAVSAGLSQVTPLAIGYLTDHVLAQQNIAFASVVPILLGILLVNVVNEVIKVIRRLIVEDTATQAEKIARRKATDALLLAPLNYFRSHMTGNIHGRLNRRLEGTVKLIKLMFMDFAPAVTTGVAAIVTIFYKLPVPVALMVVLVIPVGTFIVFRQISTQKGIRVELMDTKAEMDGTMVELLGGIETIRALDSARDEGARIEDRAEALRKKEMRHHTAMAFYDCLKFVNEAVFSVLVIGVSVLLASRGGSSPSAPCSPPTFALLSLPAPCGSCTAFWTSSPSAPCWRWITSAFWTCPRTFPTGRRRPCTPPSPPTRSAFPASILPTRKSPMRRF